MKVMHHKKKNSYTCHNSSSVGSNMCAVHFWQFFPTIIIFKSKVYANARTLYTECSYIFTRQI